MCLCSIQYGSQLEKVTFQFSTADFVYMLLFGMAALLVILRPCCMMTEIDIAQLLRAAQKQHFSAASADFISIVTFDVHEHIPDTVQQPLQGLNSRIIAAPVSLLHKGTPKVGRHMFAI